MSRFKEADFLEIYMRHDVHFLLRDFVTPKLVCFITVYPVSDLCRAPVFIGLVYCFTVNHFKTLQASN